MNLSRRTISALAEMICGAPGGGGGFHWKNFPYRSSSYLSQFFSNCDLDYVHDGSTRAWWVETVLTELNQAPSSQPTFPSDALLRVMQELLDPVEFDDDETREAALGDVNRALGRDNLQAYFDGAGRCYLRSLESGNSSAGIRPIRRALTEEELERRAELERVMNSASEDEFTTEVLVPLFRQLGFIRIAVAGHEDRSLEYGKDVWMKYQLPTDNFLYFGLQVKKGKLDSKAGSMTKNIATVLDQVRMALKDPIWDPETNRRYLVDHMFIISAGDITKAVKRLMAEQLDAEQRRTIMFLDRAQILDLWLRVQLPVPGTDTKIQERKDDVLF